MPMKSIVIKGIISTMSNKNDSQFKQEVPTKTAYLTADVENSEKLQNFGLTLYTSKDNGDNFFIVKTSKNLSCYVTGNKDELPAKLDMSVEKGVSIKTAENVEISMNIVSGENLGNEFFRLQAIKIVSMDDIEEIKANNPFEDSF